MLEGTLLLVFLIALTLKFPPKYDNINSVFHSDKISAECWKIFVCEMILSFSMKT